MYYILYIKYSMRVCCVYANLAKKHVRCKYIGIGFDLFLLYSRIMYGRTDKSSVGKKKKKKIIGISYNRRLSPGPARGNVLNMPTEVPIY